MVGNNLARDIRGANAVGMVSIWMVWNQRYPSVPMDDGETPQYQVSRAADLGALLAALRDGTETDSFRSSRAFPWN
jgi:putative hydrolase of the HAD superfamily